jgi:hypothetical protein
MDMFDDFDYCFEYSVSNDDSIEKQKMPIPKYNEKFSYYLYMDEYITDIQKSYSNDPEKIDLQFDKDFTRGTIKLNSFKYYSYDSFKSQLKLRLNLNNIVDEKIYDMDYYSFILMLCCQSTFFTPYKLINDLYDIDYMNNENVLITSSKHFGGIIIDIIINENKIMIEMKNNLFVKNIETDKITHSVTVLFSFEFNPKENKTKNKKINFIFMWNKEKEKEDKNNEKYFSFFKMIV